MESDKINESGTDFEMVATTLFGLEEVLAKELEKLGARDIKPMKRAIGFVGDKGFMYKANYWLRTALRILKPIASFTVSDDKNLYDRIKTIEWNKYLTENDLLAVSASLSTDIFNHTQYISQKTKDAVVDQFRERTGKRPSVDLDNPTVRIHIHVEGNVCTVSLDSSGQPLFKRGYRTEVNLAPLNESLAAGMIMLSGWEPHRTFIDPMCGAGTLCIEAALIACNIPPGYFRDSFGFQKWNDYDAELFNTITESALKKVNNKTFTILGSDISETVVRKAKQNVINAKMEDVVKITTVAFEDLTPPEGNGVVIFNPPYGERLNQDDVNVLYKSIGDTLKKKYAGYTAWLISSNREAVNKIGLHGTRKISLFNGALECKFLKYEMYSGTKKQGAKV
jgi:putative N6-adenine-specific DNA methylase